MKSQIGRLLAILSIPGFAFVFANSVNPLWLGNDAAQYLSIAENIADGNGIRTDVLYYDQHFESKSLPADQTIWPPGYPYLIALVHTTGLPLAQAIAFVNGGSLALCALGIWLLMRELTTSHVVAGYVVLVWLVFASTWAEAVAGMSGLSAIAASLFSMLFYIKSESVGSASNRRDLYLSLAGVFAGISFGMHYSFAFYVIAIGIAFLISNPIVTRPAFWRRGLVLVLSTSAIVLPIIWRNFAVAGTFTRAVQGDADTDIYGVFYTLAGSIGTLLGLSIDTYLLTAMVGISIISLVAIMSKPMFRSDQKAALFNNLQLPLIFVVVAFIGFVGPAFVNGLWPINSRYLGYLLPAFLITIFSIMSRQSVLGHFGSERTRLVPYILFIIILLPQIIAFNELIYGDKTVARNGEIQTLINTDIAGNSIRELLTKNISRNEPLFANEPQAMWLAVGKPVLGVPPREFSLKVWDEEAVLALVRQYGTKYVLFLPGFIGTDDRSWSRHPFYTHLKSGNAPWWLRAEILSEDVQLYSVIDE